MLYDLRVTPRQLKLAAEWTQDGPHAAEVELVADDSMLLVEQGDDRMAWDTDGSPATEQYLERAPLAGPPRSAEEQAMDTRERNYRTLVAEHEPGEDFIEAKPDRYAYLRETDSFTELSTYADIDAACAALGDDLIGAHGDEELTLHDLDLGVPIEFDWELRVCVKP